MAKNALHSLFDGSLSKKALAGNVGVPSAQRNQTVLTPRWLLDGVIEAVGMPVALDPCTTPENPVGARRYVSDGERPEMFRSALGFTGPFGWVSNDGLQEAWSVWTLGHGFAYVNPPYDSLEAWLGKCVEEARAAAPIVALVPWRSQRTWFMAAARTASWVSALAPFPFVGHSSAFPAPLCLIGWGVDPVRSIRQPTRRGSKELVTSCFEVRS